jgi:capsular polysaccharide biosynthesis protein
MQRAQEQNVAQTILPASEELVQTAAVPLERVRPRKALNVALGVALGLVFGSGAAFGLESLRRTIRTPQDVMHEIRLPVLGMIPRRQ